MLLRDLCKERVGTLQVECEALGLKMASGKYREGQRKKLKGKKKIQMIREERDPEKVVDIIKLKLKERATLKKEYVREKNILKTEL